MIAGRRFSYLIPPGEDPRIGDWALVTPSTKPKAIDVASTLVAYQIMGIDCPAHPKASKMYIASFTTKFLEERQAVNTMRDAVTHDGPRSDEKFTGIGLDWAKAGSGSSKFIQQAARMKRAAVVVPDAKKLLGEYQAAHPDVTKFWLNEFSDIEERVPADLIKKEIP